jgi:F420-dependent oxidoreductase-like protein
MEISVSIEGWTGHTWSTWTRAVRAAEELGFAAVFGSDHFLAPSPPESDSLEIVVALTWAAHQTRRVRLGTLVAPLSFRDPVMLARQAAAIDDLSGGRLVLGVGAGWQDREHEMFGYDLGDLRARMDRFEEGLQVITALLRRDQPVSFEGRYFRLREACLRPRPMRPGGPPILVGGIGPKRTLPLAARYADIWNGQRFSAEEFRECSSRLDDLIVEAGRSPRAVKRTMAMLVACGRDQRELDRSLEWIRRGFANWAALPTATFVEKMRDRSPSFVAGPPAEVVDHLATYVEAGVEEAVLEIGGLDETTLHLLGAEVLPAFGRALDNGTAGT